MAFILSPFAMGSHLMQWDLEESRENLHLYKNKQTNENHSFLKAAHA